MGLQGVEILMDDYWIELRNFNEKMKDVGKCLEKKKKKPFSDLKNNNNSNEKNIS